MTRRDRASCRVTHTGIGNRGAYGPGAAPSKMFDDGVENGDTLFWSATLR